MKKNYFNFPNTAASRNLLWGMLALVLLVFATSSVIHSLIASWHSEEYSHGFIIPLVAILIGWHRLAEKKPAVYPSLWGIGVLIVAVCFLVAGKLSAFEPPSFYGLLLALVGLCLAFGGEQVTRVLWPAFVYLLFAIPLPRLIYVGLSADLQLISSTLGVFILDLFKIPVWQDGNVIDLGEYKLQVVEACSGLRYLFPLMSFGYLIAYLLEDRFWKRGVIFLSTIPITIGMNALRIAFIGFTVDLFGIKAAEGFLHDFEGWSVFLICVLILMGEVWLLQKIGTPGQFRYNYFGPAKGALISGTHKRPAPAIFATILCAALAVLFGTGLIDQREEIVPSHTPFAQFPLMVGDWHGRQTGLNPDVLQALQLSDYLLADYRQQGEKQPVNFYMAYYASQRVGSSAHSPSNCLPGGGWQILSRTAKTIGLPGDANITVSRLLVQNGEQTELTYYWFDERGRDITEQYGAKWYLLWDSITMHRTDGALIRLMTPVESAENENAADARLTNFLTLIYPNISHFVPGAG